jgi:HTH domain
MSDHAKREPFCWLEKRKLRIIADVFAEGRLGALTSARSVYLALSEIASDRQNDTFTVATSYIAQRAGVTSKTVRRVIKILKRLGFVKIQGRSASGLKLAYEYTLIRGDRPIGLIYPTFGKARKIALPTREECDEESREGTARKEKEMLSINDNDIIIHSRTGERFNRRTKEFDW